MLKSLLILYNPFIEIEAICKLCLLIDSKLYGTFAKLYTFYVDLAGRKIFSRAALESLTNRIYIFIGIIALFFVAYTLLKAIVDPEKGLKDGGGKLVFNIASSLIMILVAPIIFELGYKVTDIIVNENVIGKIFLGGESISSGNSEISVDYSQEEKNESDEVINQAELKGNETLNVDVSRETLRVYGNQTAYIVLNAFLYPLNDSFTVNASDEYNLSSGIKYVVGGTFSGAAGAAAGTAVLVSLVGVVLAPFTGGLSLGTIPAALATGATTIGTAAIVGGVAGGVGGALYQGAGYTITYDEYTWDNAQVEMVYGGNFDIITAFSEAIEEGNMQYTPIISTICGVILLYFMIGFCLDLGIRSAKLAMFEMLAPIPILLRIVPGQDKVFKTWITQVLTTFFEVVIRIGILFGVAYLISLVPSMTIFSNDSVGMFGKAFIVLGLVAFIKEAPKLLSDVIGIKGAGNIKFNLKDKLAATGAFAAGTVIGGAAIGMLRNGVNAGRNVRDAARKHKTGDHWTKSDLKNAVKDYKNIGKAAGIGLFSTLAGGTSGAYNAIKGGGSKAKTYADFGKAVESGGNKALSNAQKRAKYKADHDGTIRGAIKGHLYDFKDDAAAWFDYSEQDVYASEMKYYDYLNKHESTIKSETEKIRKKHATNSSIVAKVVKYKGYANGELDRLHDELVIAKDASLDVLEKELATISNRATFNKGEFVKYFDGTNWVNGIIDELGQVLEYDAKTGKSGKLVAESASLLHNKYAAAFGSFVTQLTKETDLGLQDAAAAKSGAIYTLIESDSATLASSLTQVGEIYAEGLTKKAVQKAQSDIAAKGITGAGHVYKAYMDAITDRTAEINAEKAKADRLRELRDSRKKDK